MASYTYSGTTLTDDQYKKLLKNNPTLAAKYSSTGGSTSPAPATSGNITLPVTGSGNVSGGSIKLTPEQQAKVAKNNPSLAQSIGLPSYTSGASGSTTSTPKTSLADKTNELLPQAENRSSLVEFADMLNQATKLARDRRQASELGILEDYGFKPGQVRSATMGSILNLLQQRTDTSYGTLRDAAITAYQDETKRKADDLANKQSLALELLTSGNLDEKGVAAILATSSTDEALKVAAAQIKASDPSITDVREANGKLIKTYKDGTTEFVDIPGGASGGEQFTLGTNQVRYDAQGNVVARGPAGGGGGTTEYAPTTDMKEYEYAKTQGYTGTFEDWKNAKGGGTNPSYSGETLDLGSTDVGWFDKQFGNGKSEYEENVDKLIAAGVTQSDIDEVQRLLSTGLSLKQIAQDSNMPNATYLLFNEYIVKP